jgi:hypothetical protein
MSDLVSKVLAGGLSAALFLFWWPTAVPGSGPEWLLLRGILWALVFELLLLSFCPLERAVTGALRARAIRGLTPRQGARALALALAGLAVPAALMHGAQPERATARAAIRPPAKERVIVKREIVRREVVVKRVNKIVPVSVPGPTTTVAVASAAAPARRASTPTRTRSTTPAKAEVVVKAPAPRPAAAPTTATPSSATPTSTTPAPAPASTAPSPAAAPAG